MNDTIIPILTKLLQQYGNGLCSDTRRLKALLSDLTSGCKREINVLIQAADCRIGQELAQQANSKLDVFAYNNFVQRLIDETSITNEAAAWAIRAWATALNKQLPSNAPHEMPPQKATASAIPKTAAPTDVRVTSEQKRLLDIMLNPQYPPQERAAAGREINKMGDPRPGVGLRPDGLPDIVWCEVPGGEFTMSGINEYDYGKPISVTLPTFYIAKYLVTYSQFQAFLDAKDGYSNSTWWKDLHADGFSQRGQREGQQKWRLANHPRENVSWYDAMSFCSWLSVKLGYEITLPTEEQWEKAARGAFGREYPWGNGYQIGFANIDNEPPSIRSGPNLVGQTTAVGIYPQGVSPYGVHDLSGNVWEWVLQSRGAHKQYLSNDDEDNSSYTKVRGGSWNSYADQASAVHSSFGCAPEYNDNDDIGFRLAVVGFPSSSPLNPARPKADKPIFLRITSDPQRLLAVMLNPERPPQERAEAGREINKVGDPRPGVGLHSDGLLDIIWCKVPGGEFTMGAPGELANPLHQLTLPTFYIAKYLITYAQFQVFLDAKDGYANTLWWKGLHPYISMQQKEGASQQEWSLANHPRENVSWYDAIAFSRWLSTKLGYTITLPTEEQWEKAARGGDKREYPWGNDYQIGFANIKERYNNFGPHDLGQTTAVGIYPQGASPYGVLDLAGNVWEWTLTEYTSKNNVNVSSEVSSYEARAMRGGSWGHNQYLARALYRDWTYPRAHFSNLGFRLMTEKRPFSTPR